MDNSKLFIVNCLLSPEFCSPKFWKVAAANAGETIGTTAASRTAAGRSQGRKVDMMHPQNACPLGYRDLLEAVMGMMEVMGMMGGWSSE